ncbi:MAG: hypothetical protein IT239_04340 [Bacteroidia bacterium]|nr:hypothetical protein [Bacteroidia bacterium]
MLETKKAILNAELVSGNVKLEHYKEHIFTLFPHFTEDEIFKMLGIRPPYQRYYNEFKEKPYSLYLIAKDTIFNNAFGFMYVIIEDDEKRKVQVHGGKWVSIQNQNKNIVQLINFLKNT